MTLEELARGAIDRAAELHAENAALKEENERLKARAALLAAPAVQGEPENWREKVADLIKAAHCEGQKSATGRDPSPFRWVNSESYKAAQALLAAPIPEAVQGEVEPFAYCFTDVNGKAKELCEKPTADDNPNDLRVVTPLYTHPAPAEQQSISPTLASEAAKHLSNWLEMDMCECEFGHTCGYNEVKRTRDALLGVAEQKPAPDVAGLVEALEQCITSMLDSGYRANAVVIRAARAALSAHRKGGCK